MATDTRHEWTVGPQDAGTRLDRFLTNLDVLGTRSQVQRLIEDGHVQVGARSIKPGTVLRPGDRVVVTVPPPAPIDAEPAAIELNVLYEDEWLMAINKPAGLVVHPAPGHRQGTLVSALLHRWSTMPSDLDPNRLGIVHRLDKDTSGVLLIAKTAAVLAELGRQFHDRAVDKRYLALVWGVPRRARGVIDEPIGRHPVHRKRMAIRKQGRAAVTRYEVVEDWKQVALVRAHPATGRTHQIRVHLASLGHPIVGDRVYGRGRDHRAVAIERQALHAEAIRFRHPVRGEPMSLKAPLAPDFAAALAALRDIPLTSHRPFTSVRRDSTTPHARSEAPDSPGRRRPA